jgi:hypothetical protein
VTTTPNPVTSNREETFTLDRQANRLTHGPRDPSADRQERLHWLAGRRSGPAVASVR